MEEDYPNAKEVLKTEVPRFEGEKVSINDVINREVIILAFKAMPSTYYPDSDYAAISINDNGSQKWFTTSSAVLVSQLKKLEQINKLPAKAVFRKEKRYYTML